MEGNRSLKTTGTERTLKEYEIKLGGEKKKVNAGREKGLCLWVPVSFILIKAFEVKWLESKRRVKIHCFLHTFF